MIGEASEVFFVLNIMICQELYGIAYCEKHELYFSKIAAQMATHYLALIINKREQVLLVSR